MKYKFLEKENWFKHDFRSREDKKLIRLKMKWKSAAPIGIFWQLCEMIYENAGMLDYDLDVIAFNCGDTTELVEDVIKMCFIITDDNKLTHETIIQQLDERDELYQKSVEKGREGANKRWAKYRDTNSDTIPTPKSPNSNPIGSNTRVESRQTELREESKELIDTSKLLAVYKKPDIDVFITDEDEIDYFQDDTEIVMSRSMLDKIIDKFVAVDSRFKFNSVMREINEDYGGFDNLLEMYLPDEVSAHNNFRKQLNQYQNGIFK